MSENNFNGPSSLNFRKFITRATRKRIGKVDPETGEIIPNRAKASPKPSKRGPFPATDTARSFCGATYLFDAIGDELDVIECFEQTGKAARIGELTRKQTELYETLGIEPSESLQ